MLQKSTIVRHYFAGGWGTDFGTSVDVAPDQGGRVNIPFLVDAENCLFELDGGPRKVGGTTKVNSSAVASGAVVTGLHDYWRQGTAGSPSRRRVIHAGTVIMADADDGIFANIFTGLTAAAVPSYFTFDDLLIISSDASGDVPRSWDQTTAQNLGGTPPRFSFGTAHKNRAWAAGVYALPSRLYYSANTDPEDWVGAGSGSIDIDPNDGDMITGLVSHKDNLFVFKGPNKGSIHMITGSAPTGSDGFARKLYVRGIGACWHNAIFPFADDIGFVSQYGSVHSLAATNAYGDFLQSSLSLPINQKGIRDRLNYNRLRNIWAATDPLTGLVMITASFDAATTNNAVLVMDFRTPNNIRWSKITAYAAASLATFVDTNGNRRILAGGNDGFVRRLNIADRSIDVNTSIAFKVTTPTMNYGNPWNMKTIGPGSLGLAPRGAGDITFGWTRDLNAQQTATLTQSGGDILGPTTAVNPFTMNTSLLSGMRYVETFNEMEEGGEFRLIQYQIKQNTTGGDVEVHSITAQIVPGAISTSNTAGG